MTSLFTQGSFLQLTCPISAQVPQTGSENSKDYTFSSNLKVSQFSGDTNVIWGGKVVHYT